MNLIHRVMLLMAFLLATATSYSLTGQWKLKNLDGQPTDKNISLQISQTVVNTYQVRNILNFSNCHNIAYLVNIKQNFMQIDQNPMLTRNQSNPQQTNSECSQQQSNLEKHIVQTLKKVFFFAIKTDLLVFVSPNGNDLLEFTRVKKIYLTNLTGSWFLDQIYWERASNSEVKFNEDKVTLCDGKVEATYTTNNVDQISFNITKNDNCDQQNLTKALSHIKYYRLKDIQLQLFDQNLVQVTQLIYKNGNKLNQQQKILTTDKPSNQTKILYSQNPSKVDQTVQSNLRSQQKPTN